MLLFLPPYSPDLNPIEESFSAGMGVEHTIQHQLTHSIVKAWIRRHWRRLANSQTPKVDLLEACGAVTAEKARSWFRHSGYM